MGETKGHLRVEVRNQGVSCAECSIHAMRSDHTAQAVSKGRLIGVLPVATPAISTGAQLQRPDTIVDVFSLIPEGNRIAQTMLGRICHVP
jgi:hypothetical protein